MKLFSSVKRQIKRNYKDSQAHILRMYTHPTKSFIPPYQSYMETLKKDQRNR